MPHLEYHLTVQGDGLVRAAFQGAGRQDQRTDQLDMSQLTHLEGLLPDVQQQAGQTRHKLMRLGTYLYQMLFTGQVRGHFAEIVWPLLSPTTTLTISLAFQASDSKRISQAAALPWEFLYYPQGNGTFLATDSRCRFVRRWQETWPQPDLLPEQSHLRVLLAHLQPEDASPVSLVRIGNVLQELGEERGGKRPLIPLILSNPTPIALADNLNNIRPHILHLLLHGRFSEDGTRFGFVDGAGQTRWYGDRSLAALFSTHRPQLVILQACAGGQLSALRSFANGAAWLVREAIPAVVAMQYPITNEVGWEFTEQLYKALADGQNVATAVQRGRQHLAHYDLSLPDDHARRDFAAVVLWQQPLSGQKEKKGTMQAVTIVTPDGERFGTDVASDTLIGQLIRAFVGHWQPFAERSMRYVFHLGSKEKPGLETAVTLAEAAIPDGAELWLTAEQLKEDDPVGITIEDGTGQRFITAVLLTTTVQELRDSFLVFHPQANMRGGKTAVELISGLPGIESRRRLQLHQTLYHAGVSQDALLRMTTVPVQEEK